MLVRLLRDKGYRLYQNNQFFLDTLLPDSGNKDIMKSQGYGFNVFSGPLHLPYQFISFEKIK